MEERIWNEAINQFRRLLKERKKERKKENETDNDVFCTMLLTISPNEDVIDDFFFINKAVEFMENDKEASVNDVFDYLVSIRADFYPDSDEDDEDDVSA
ncbi:MAG: hypothetical protein NC084_12170 [Bacteroides sp.]|nr:hypothetical protein [Eubacterium sp.]MCM1419519.1 hypothetical protein [Roseburia sp.]MCM1463449.1 hypothetical protein [Bacteroides sp.]